MINVMAIFKMQHPKAVNLCNKLSFTAVFDMYSDLDEVFKMTRTLPIRVRGKFLSRLHLIHFKLRFNI